MSKDQKLKFNSFLGFGNPEFSGEISRLPYTEQEIISSAAFFSNSRKYTGLQANRDVLEGFTTNVDVLHFATHAIYEPLNPSSSYILLSGQPGDNSLTINDIQSLRFKPYFVVLSACDTGKGKITEGDELLSLNRAFIGLGAKSTLSTLWKIDDQQTAHLVNDFYSNLKSTNIANALQISQKNMVDKGLPPKYWAGFYISGSYQ